MAYDPTPSDPVDPAREPGSGLTGYAAVKYGFIFLIVVAILYFAAAYAIPALTD